MRVKIGFATSTQWISRIIRFFTNADTSHTYIVFDQIPEVDEEIYEAAWCGFRLSTREKLCTEGCYIVREVPVDIDPRRALLICRSWLETPYDYLGLFGELPVQIGRWFGQRWPNWAAGPHHMYCSEAATKLLQAFDVTATRDLDARATSPEDLELALLKRPA